MYGAKIMECQTTEKETGEKKYYTIVYTDFNTKLHRLTKAIEIKFNIVIDSKEYDSIKGQLRHSRRKINTSTCINKSNLQEDARMQIKNTLIYIYHF